MKQKLKNTKGITLVALIITIIVLLILAVVAITSISNSNIINNAKNAGTAYTESEEKEKVTLAVHEAMLAGKGTISETTIADGMNSQFPNGGWEKVSSDADTITVKIKTSQRQYKITLSTGAIELVTGGSSGGNDPTPPTASKKVNDNIGKVLSDTDNKNLEDEYGNKIKVPAGFKILVDSTTGYTSDNINVTKGIVVEDGDGNQFVWIPVGTIYTNIEKTESKTITLGRYSNFTKNADGTYTVTQNANIVTTAIKLNDYYSEYTTANYRLDCENAIAKNIEEFCIKANKNGGYYIGRYEARVENYDASNISTSNSSKSGEWTGYIAESGKKLKLVSKANQQVWNYITQPMASSLCKNMYTNKPFESDLINSYAWDTAIIFFQEFGDNITYASKKSVNTNLANTGTSGTSYSGTRDTICNVYDMAGNCCELTTETYIAPGIPCTIRGGNCNIYGNTSNRTYYGTVYASYNDSFRPILYL